MLFCIFFIFLGSKNALNQEDKLVSVVGDKDPVSVIDLQHIEPSPMENVSAGELFQDASNLSGLSVEELAWALERSKEEDGSLWSVLGEIEKRGSFKLLPNLHDKYTSVKVKGKIEILKVISGTEFFEKPESAKVIIEALGDNDYLVRGFAAKLSSNFESEMIANAVEQRLEVEENEVVRNVLQRSFSG